MSHTEPRVKTPRPFWRTTFETKAIEDGGTAVLAFFEAVKIVGPLSKSRLGIRMDHEFANQCGINLEDQLAAIEAARNAPTVEKLHALFVYVKKEIDAAREKDPEHQPIISITYNPEEHEVCLTYMTTRHQGHSKASITFEMKGKNYYVRGHGDFTYFNSVIEKFTGLDGLFTTSVKLLKSQNAA